MDVTSFRTAFPEFASASAFHDTLVTYWLGIGAKLVNAERWGTMTDHGVALLAAHFLVLAKQNQTQGKAGSAGMGAVSAKSVDKVSVNYDAAMGSVEGAGAWNATSYGRQYAQLAAMYGAGGMQL